MAEYIDNDLGLIEPIQWKFRGVEDGKAVVETTQEESPIIEANQSLRGARKDLTFGRHVASIPMILYNRWMKKYPELRQPNPEIRSKKLFELLKDPDNQGCLVQDRSRVFADPRGNKGIIIRQGGQRGSFAS